ncbi:MAG: 30S ribosomal protein S9 [Patescibacteria group bacterium]|nr:30S ribosomal protein S9 [Patescibacteria group bacterium]MDD5566838.1 30S ribosomal protein S9 [Patescibacteria group bacterium]
MFAVGRRKTAIARVRYYKKGEGKYTVNGQPVEKYFKTLELQNLALAPLKVLANKLEGDISVKVSGGGVRGQADSVRHGLARLLVTLDLENRPQLKRLGFLRRDARVKERKKYGLKRARRAPQWQKR